MLRVEVLACVARSAEVALQSASYTLGCRACVADARWKWHIDSCHDTFEIWCVKPFACLLVLGRLTERDPVNVARR